MRDTGGATDEQREFLQICSLIREPIELDVLRRIVGNESDLESLIARSSERYVVMDGATLRFSHFLIAEAIRPSVSSSLVLRRRIIRAYLDAKSPRAGDYTTVSPYWPPRSGIPKRSFARWFRWLRQRTRRMRTKP